MNQTIVYTYDNGGNIKSKKIYAYTTATDPGTPTQTISYTYDSTWKDKLTNYNGTAVTYKYDADGLRNYKKVGNTVHEYEYVGGQLVYEKRGDLKFYYRYNAMGELASIKRINAAGSEYTVYVVTNTRGDIEELRLADGTLYARYVYDSWGNVLHVYNGSGVEETNANALSLQNPFRYRSYYYDTESGLYYLQSRYYDPVTCRFVNADGLLNTQDLQGYNVFLYCVNDPINYVDHTGYCYKTPDGKWINCETSDYIYMNKIDPNDYDDDSYYEPRDKSVNGDRQKRNKKQIRDALGKDRSDREKQSRDLHDAKKGRRNDDNMPYGSLNSGDYWDYIVVVGCGVAIAWVITNNVSGVGVVDDITVAPIIYIMKEELT